MSGLSSRSERFFMAIVIIAIVGQSAAGLDALAIGPGDAAVGLVANLELR